MPKIILINRICSDGFGDLSHLIDIYSYLETQPQTKQFELIPVICCDDDEVAFNVKARFEKALKKIQSFDIPVYFYGNEAAYNNVLSKDPILIQCFSEAVQIINISYAGIFGVFRELLSYANPQVILKHIGEHESADMVDEKWLNRSMGLSKKSYGIKIKSIEKSTVDDAFSIIDEDNKLFSQALLGITQDHSFVELKKKCLLAVAYCQHQKAADFLLFLLLLGVNESISVNHIAVYLSSNHIQLLVTEIIRSKDFFKHFCNIKQIEWIDEANNKTIIEIHPNARRTISIIYGHFLSDKAYQAFYSCVDIAAVTGDNTLEHAIAHQVLPYYRSFNYSNKHNTLLGMRQIINELRSTLPEKVAKDFLEFFAYYPVSRVPNNARNESDKLISIFKQWDLMAMIQYWPKIAQCITVKHNFYNQLDTIFYENLTTEPVKDECVTNLSPKVVFLSLYKPTFFATNQNKILAATAALAVIGGLSLLGVLG